MPELITLYTEDAPEAPMSCERMEYYRNVFTTYKEHHPAIIDIFLFNKYGDVLLQKRARNKLVSPGQFNTSVGGHISWGERPKIAAIHECLEELGAPAFVFSKDAFVEAFERLGAHTDKAAIVYEVGSFFRNHLNDPLEHRRSIKDRVWLYFGRYDGPLETRDRESAGYEWISMEDLEKEFVKSPEQFTAVLKLFMEIFGDDMRAFISTFCRVE